VTHIAADGKTPITLTYAGALDEAGRLRTMRTTLASDDDVAAMLRQLVAERGVSSRSGEHRAAGWAGRGCATAAPVPSPLT
jgi:hypothetical protein